MTLWRCPHCATPQPESSRCWLCGRSTTTCAACRHFRRGVAGGLGLCGRNPRRLALQGTEVLPCWEAVPAADEGLAGHGPGAAALRSLEEAERRPPRTFVPVDELRAVGKDSPPAPPTPVARSAGPTRWSLWGDGDL